MDELRALGPQDNQLAALDRDSEVRPALARRRRRDLLLAALGLPRRAVERDALRRHLHDEPVGERTSEQGRARRVEEGQVDLVEVELVAVVAARDELQDARLVEEAEDEELVLRRRGKGPQALDAVDLEARELLQADAGAHDAQRARLVRARAGDDVALRARMQLVSRRSARGCTRRVRRRTDEDVDDSPTTTKSRMGASDG